MHDHAMNYSKIVVYDYNGYYKIHLMDDDCILEEIRKEQLEDVFAFIEERNPEFLILYHNKTLDEIYSQHGWGEFLYYHFGHSPWFPVKKGNAEVIFILEKQ